MLPNTTTRIRRPKTKIVYSKDYLKGVCATHSGVKGNFDKYDTEVFDSVFDCFFEAIGAKIAANSSILSLKKTPAREVFAGIFCEWASVYQGYSGNPLLASSNHRFVITNDEALGVSGRRAAIIAMKYILATLSRIEVSEDGMVYWPKRNSDDFGLAEACILCECRHTGFMMPRGGVSSVTLEMNSLALMGEDSLLDFHCCLGGDIALGARVTGDALLRIFSNICNFSSPLTRPLNLFCIRDTRATKLLEEANLTPAERSILTGEFNITDFAIEVEQLESTKVMAHQQLLENEEYWQKCLDRYIRSNDLIRSLATKEKRVLSRGHLTCVSHPRTRKYK